MFVWGGDHFGQLGLGRKKRGRTYSSPRFCSFTVLIKEASCGEEHSCFISGSGHVYSIGNNSEGSLGIGDRTIPHTSSPRLVESLLSCYIQGVACGWRHTLAYSREGACFAWGLGEFGALGTGRVESQWSPVRVKLPRKLRVYGVSSGSRHSAVLCSNKHREGVLFIWGSGDSGQLGIGTTQNEIGPVELTETEQVKQVSLGTSHTLLLTVEGKVLATGDNSFGQLGVGNKENTTSPVAVMGLQGVKVEKVACGSHSACISNKGELFVWGTGAFGEYLLPEQVLLKDSAVEVSVGGSFAAVLDSAGVLYTWGVNSDGELGLKDYEPRVSPTPVGPLEGKTVTQIACGGTYCLCLGGDISASEGKITEHSESTHFKADKEVNNSSIQENSQADGRIHKAKQRVYNLIRSAGRFNTRRRESKGEKRSSKETEHSVNSGEIVNINTGAHKESPHLTAQVLHSAKQVLIQEQELASEPQLNNTDMEINRLRKQLEEAGRDNQLHFTENEILKEQVRTLKHKIKELK